MLPGSFSIAGNGSPLPVGCSNWLGLGNRFHLGEIPLTFVKFPLAFSSSFLSLLFALWPFAFLFSASNWNPLRYSLVSLATSKSRVSILFLLSEITFSFRSITFNGPIVLLYPMIGRFDVSVGNTRTLVGRSRLVHGASSSRCICSWSVTTHSLLVPADIFLIFLSNEGCDVDCVVP